MTLRDSDPVSWLVAHEEIRQLASRYAVYMDARDLDGLVGLFVPDVRVAGGGVGRDALRESFESQLRALRRSILVVGNHVIDVTDENNASGVVSCRGEIEPVDTPEQWIVQQIQYHDTYQRVDGRWLFVKRKHLLWYGADMLSRPINLDDANWPQSHSGKGVLPEWYDTWKQWNQR